jgi:hypothetical protein
MALTYQYSSLQMEWCLSCHRNPERFVRPRDKVFDMAWRQENKSGQEIIEGKELVARNRIQKPNVLTSCSTCHR